MKKFLYRNSLIVHLSALLICLTVQAALAQSYVYDTGSPTYGVNFPVPNGLINVANGNVHLEIPLATFTQRGNLPPLSIKLVYDSRIWRINQNVSTYSWQPNNIFDSMAGWRLSIGAGGYTYQASPGACSTQFQHFAFVDNHGTQHVFPFKTIQYPSGCSGTATASASGYATDSSGYYATVTNYTNITIYDGNGVQIYHYDGTLPNVGEVDANGNSITYSGTQADPTITDSVNRSPITVTTNGNTIQYGILTTGGGRNTFTVTTEPLSVNTAFAQQDVQEFTGTLTAIQSIELPDGTSYQFSYDANQSWPGEYGELTGINLPFDGGVGSDVAFGWGSFFDSYQNVNRWITSYGGPEGSTTFTPKVLTQCSGSTKVGCQEQMTVTRASGDATVYTLTLNNGAWNTQTDYFKGSATTGTKEMTTVTGYDWTNSCDPAICQGAQWVTASYSQVTLDDVGQTSKTLFTYAQPWIGKPSKVQQWDYTAGTPGGTPTRETDYTYGYTVNGAALVTQENAYFNGAAFGQTIYNYDQGTPTATSGLPQHQSVSGPRGNLTSVTAGLPGGSQITTSFSYDDAGMLISSTDANQNTTSYSYMCEDAYTSQVTYPSISSISHIGKSSEDCNTGSLISSTDQNNQTTTYGYDSLGRPSSVSYPDGGQTSYSYPSPTQSVITKLINGSTSSVQTTTLDEFGRTSKVSMSDPAGNDAVSYSYDSNGRLGCVTNPERSTASTTDGTTCYLYDFLDRPTQVTQTDLKKLGVTYSGNQATVTDENGHLRRYQYDAFHDLTATWEPDSTGALNWETDYTYDGAGRLTKITQNGSNSGAARVRSFSYDSLGRLASKNSPEAGTATFTYDGNGNAITSKDARGIIVTNTYDALNRITAKSSSDNSFQYSYTYDVATTAGGFSSANPVGRLVVASNNVNASEQYSYDSMGRVAYQTSCIPSNCSQTGNAVYAQYDLAGDLSSLTYPDGRTVTYSYDSAEHMTGIQYASWNGQPVNTSYLNSATTTFAPTGQMTAGILGNGVQIAASFGPRQTISTLQYKTSSQTLWAQQFTWAANAQNLVQVVDTTSAPQTYNYSYDPDNRLTSAIGGGQTLVSPASSGTGSVSISGLEQKGQYVPPGCKQHSCASTIYDSGSVAINVNNYAASVNYDDASTSSSVALALVKQIDYKLSNYPVRACLAGTTIRLTAKATGAITNYSLTTTSTWDAQTFKNPSFGGATSGSALTGGADAVYNGTAVLNESYNQDAWGNLQQSGNFSFIQGFGNNNQVSTAAYGYDSAGNLTSDGLGNSYSYDGEGKLTASSGVNYVYDASGQRVEKVAGSNATEYIYFNGQPVAILNPSTGAWTDLIIAGGVPLAEVAGNQTASPMYRLTDHLGSLVVETDNSGNPIGSNLYAPYGQMMASSVSDPFAYTSLERDTENGSYHATMRNYSLAPGRWLSPDPYDGSYDLMNPQSLNRYAYVNGNPLAYTDPTGLMLDGAVGAAAPGVCAANPIACAALFVGGALLDWKVFDNIFGGGPSFHGSLSPRPTSGTSAWDGNFGESLGIPVNGPPFSMGGVVGALGLPSGGCEFGACGPGPSGFSPGSVGANFSKITVDPRLMYVADALNWAFTGKHSGPFPRIHGNWCGPGGSGFPVDGHDWNCMFHDYCYSVNNLSASDNLFIQPPGKRALLHGCNQALCNGESKLGGSTASEINGYFSIVPSADNGCTQ